MCLESNQEFGVDREGERGGRKQLWGCGLICNWESAQRRNRQLAVHQSYRVKNGDLM